MDSPFVMVHLGAKRAAGKWMTGISLNSNDHAVLNMHQHTAGVGTVKGAYGTLYLCRHNTISLNQNLARKTEYKKGYCFYFPKYSVTVSHAVSWRKRAVLASIPPV